LITILVIGFAIYAIKKIKNPFIWLALLLIIIPFLGATALSIKSSIYLDRYFIFTLPFFLILIGGAIFKIGNKTIRGLLIAIAIFGTFISFPIHWNNLNASKKSGMAGTANYLNQQIKPDEKIYVGSSFVYFTFKYYNKTGVAPLLFAPGYLPHFSGTALLSPKDIIKDFNRETQKGDIVWLINTTGFGNYRPETPKNWIFVEEKGFQDIYNYRGWIVVTKYQVN
ncbi:MAG: hypothetical protein U9P88_02380, partial [Patescibacteria group bacterium]|nr:hypothetical protein [Patescibacteria group bacterium]